MSEYMINGSNVNILLVDDDEIDAMFIRRTFRQQHLPNKIYHTCNGSEALNLGSRELKRPVFNDF